MQNLHSEKKTVQIFHRTKVLHGKRVKKNHLKTKGIRAGNFYSKLAYRLLINKPKD